MLLLMADAHDVVVCGGGLAGLSTALTAARLGRRTLALSGGPPGGLLLSIERIDGLPGFPDGVPGYELCPVAQEQAAAAGAEFSMAELDRLEQADEGWTVVTVEGELSARTVVLATGARFARLGVDGEERLQGHGISTCASCDAPLLQGRPAAVVGGGDSALQEALTLAETLERVVIVHRGEELDAQATYVQRVLEHPAIEVRRRSVLEEILGEEAVSGVRVRDLDSDEVDELEVAAVFPFVGLIPNSERVEGLVPLDDDGHVITDAEQRTALPGVLAAGIVCGRAAGRAAAAAGQGATAAIAADAYLREGDWPVGLGVAATAGGGGAGG